MADLREQTKITAELEKQKEILKAHNETSREYIEAQKEINRLNVQRVAAEKSIGDARSATSDEAERLSLEKQILRIKN